MSSHVIVTAFTLEGCSGCHEKPTVQVSDTTTAAMKNIAGHQRKLQAG